MESVFPAMLSVDGKNAAHLTRWLWFENDPLVVRLQIQVPNGVQQWELSREMLVQAAVIGEEHVGTDGARIRFELSDQDRIPRVYLLMAALLPKWDQEGALMLMHMTTDNGVHQHVFVPTLWLAPFLEETMAVVPDGGEVYDVDLLISQIFEEAEGMKL